MKNAEMKVADLINQYNQTLASMKELREIITGIIGEGCLANVDTKYHASIQISLAMDNLMELQKLFTALSSK